MSQKSSSSSAISFVSQVLKRDNPRTGRLLSAIEFAFLLSRGEPNSTTGLVRACYPVEHILASSRVGIRSNVARAPATCAAVVASALRRAWSRSIATLMASSISWPRNGLVTKIDGFRPSCRGLTWGRRHGGS